MRVARLHVVGQMTDTSLHAALATGDACFVCTLTAHPSDPSHPAALGGVCCYEALSKSLLQSNAGLVVSVDGADDTRVAGVVLAVTPTAFILVTLSHQVPCLSGLFSFL